MVRFVVASGVPTGIDMAVGAAPAPSTTSSPAVAAVAAGGVRRVGTLRAAGAWCCVLVGRHMSADTAIVRHHSRGQGAAGALTTAEAAARPVVRSGSAASRTAWESVWAFVAAWERAAVAAWEVAPPGRPMMN